MVHCGIAGVLHNSAGTFSGSLTTRLFFGRFDIAVAVREQCAHVGNTGFSVAINVE
jgi:hypothetical protein